MDSKEVSNAVSGEIGVIDWLRNEIANEIKKGSYNNIVDLNTWLECQYKAIGADNVVSIIDRIKYRKAA